MNERNRDLAQCFRSLRGLRRELERCETRVERSVLRTEIRSEVRTLERHRSEIASRAEAGDASSRALLDLVDRGAASARADRRSKGLPIGVREPSHDQSPGASGSSGPSGP